MKYKTTGAKLGKNLCFGNGCSFRAIKVTWLHLRSLFVLFSWNNFQWWCFTAKIGNRATYGFVWGSDLYNAQFLYLNVAGLSSRFAFCYSRSRVFFSKLCTSGFIFYYSLPVSSLTCILFIFLVFWLFVFFRVALFLVTPLLVLVTPDWAELGHGLLYPCIGQLSESKQSDTLHTYHRQS